MAIVCGVDFSESATSAANAAAHLAARAKLPLHLVHTLEVDSDEESGEPWRALQASAAVRLRRLAERLGELAGPVEIHVETGLPDERLLEVARAVAAKLVVIGPAGRRHGKTALGGHADRLAQRSHAPVIVVRAGAPFERWALESRPLRVVLGTDASSSSETALRWVRELCAFGPCEVIAVHLHWPPEEFQRLGLGGVRSYIEPDPEVSSTLEREFRERLSQLPGSVPVKFRTEPHLGRVADRLAELAAEEEADLVVIGSRSRNTLERLWEGSVSRGVLRCARGSVACIPAPASLPERELPEIRAALVATDFSPTGDSAVPLAHAAVAPGGTVHLVHVVEGIVEPLSPHDIFPNEQKTNAFEAARKRLLEKVPSDASARGRVTRVHVLESRDAAKAICQAAERLGVDLVCVGTRRGSSAKKALLGSVALEVLARCRRPVLLAPAPVE